MTATTDAIQDTPALRQRAFKPRDVAKQLDMGYEEVLALIHSGVLPALRVGPGFRVPDIAIEHYLRSCLPAEDPE